MIIILIIIFPYVFLLYYSTNCTCERVKSARRKMHPVHHTIFTALFDTFQPLFYFIFFSLFYFRIFRHSVQTQQHSIES